MKRFALVFAVVAALAVVAVPGASALAFADEPCLENHESSGLVLVCPGGTVGAAYSVQLAPKPDSGNGPPYKFILRSGALPDGLSLSSSGLISGRPTTAGTATFGIELQDNPGGCAGCGCVNRTPQTCAFRDFSIAVTAGLELGRDPLPPGTVGGSYSTQLKASVVTGPGQTSPPSSPVSWSITAGALPPGLALGATDGTITGAPTAVGSYTFTVQGALDPTRTDLETYTIDVKDPVVIASVKISKGSETGVPISVKLTATGGAGTFTWTLSAGSLPSGVTLATDGTLSGTPTASGKFAFTIQAADAEGRTATVSQNLVVAPKLGFKTVKLKTARAGKLYSATLKTLGGVAPVTWRILGGKLPHGIRFQKKLGVFAGTAKKAGTYRVSVEATDALGVKSKKTFVLVVKSA